MAKSKDSNSRPHKLLPPQANFWTKKGYLQAPVPPLHLSSLLRLHSSEDLVDHVPAQMTDKDKHERERENLTDEATYVMNVQVPLGEWNMYII